MSAGEAEQLNATRVAEFVRSELTKRKYVLLPSNTSAASESLVFKGQRFEITTALYCGATYIAIQAWLPVVYLPSSFENLLKELNAMNVRIPIGSFELNVNAGKIYFKIGITIPPLPDGDVLERLVSLAAGAVDAESETLWRLSDTDSFTATV